MHQHMHQTVPQSLETAEIAEAVRQPAVQTTQVHCVANAQEQVRTVNRLGEIIVRPGGNSLEAMFSVPQCCHENHRKRCSPGSFPNPTTDRESIHAWHVHVEKHQCRFRSSDPLEGFRATCHRECRIPFEPKNFGKEHAVHFLIIDDQDFICCGSLHGLGGHGHCHQVFRVICRRWVTVPGSARVLTGFTMCAVKPASMARS
jgi:hypothetical protein